MATPDDVARAETVDSGRDSTAPASQPPTLPVALPPPLVFRRELSRGGMGRVLIAWDELHGREVAVKIIGSDNPELMTRFSREAQVTARLQHPSIVPVYHSGTLADGEPFYVMRLVSGRSLDVVVKNRRLPARLALLPEVIAAVDAVAYAHDRHVVHRDLKPQNILVGQFGETVVIDWGLAKDLVALVEAPATSSSPSSSGTSGPSLTQHGQVMGTPAYMPPEQARGEEVDERADVYALGAVLYHVLAGVPPYDGPSGAAVIAEVLEKPPPPLEKGLPADLRTIVEKAMARDPRRRYPSASELADDLKKLQAGQMVGAHDYSLLELVRRFAARHIAAVSVGGILAVAMIVLTVVGLRRITRARDAAEVERGQALAARESAEALVRYLVVELAERLERSGSIDLLRGVGETVVRYEESTGRAAGQRSPRQARALELMAKAEGPRGDLATAERALRASREIRRRLAASAPTDAVAQRELLDVETQLIDVLLQRGGITPDVTAFMAREPTLVREAETRDDPAWLDAISEALATIAVAREMGGGIEAETVSLRAAVRAGERAVALAPKEAHSRQTLATARGDLADVLRRGSHLDEARDELARALALEEALVAEHPEESYTYDLWRGLQHAALLACQRGDYHQADAYGARTMPLVLDLVHRHPENADYREAQIFTLDLLGSLAFDQGRYPEARGHFAELARLSNAMRGGGLDLHDVESKRGHALQTLGWVEVLTGHPEAGIAPMVEAVALQEHEVATRPGDSTAEQDLAEQLSDLGYAELKARRFSDAVTHLTRAVAIVDANLPRDPSSMSWQVRACYALAWLGAAQGGAGRGDEAHATLERAVDFAGKLFDAPRSPDDSEALVAVAEASALAMETLGARAPAKAQPLLRRVLPILEEAAKKGELYVSAASELKRWRRLVR